MKRDADAASPRLSKTFKGIRRLAFKSLILHHKRAENICNMLSQKAAFGVLRWMNGAWFMRTGALIKISFQTKAALVN